MSSILTRLTVDTSPYQNVHYQPPRGKRTWTFVLRIKCTSYLDEARCYQGEYKECLGRAKAAAKSLGAFVIYVQP